MQNFGTPNPSAQPPLSQEKLPFPLPEGTSSFHYQQYKTQLQQYQSHQVAVLNRAASLNQINQQQLQHAMHQVNEKIRQTFNTYQAQVQRSQQQQQQQQGQGQYPAGSNDGGVWRGNAGVPGSMPPPQMTPGGQMQQMSAAEKKKMLEMKRMQAQQQQQQQAAAAGRGFPPGTTPQQHHQMRMQQQQQQHPGMQNNGYPRMMGQPAPGQQTPQYPNPMNHQGIEQLQHMPSQGPQSHGPASVSNAAQQQFQQQQYYQQQQQQNQMHLQQHQQMSQQQMQMQQHQNMQMSQQGMRHDGFQGQHMQQHPQHVQMQAMQQHHMSQQQAQQQQAAQQAAAAQAQAPENAEQQRYNELLKEMKTQYLEVLLGMQRRQAQQKGLTQMVEILEGRRSVTWEHLQTLKGSLHRLMVRDCPTFPLMEEIRKAVERKMENREKALSATAIDKESLAAAVEMAEKRLTETKVQDPFEVSPWRSVKHLTIRVPESVRRLIQSKSPSPKRSTLKRPHDGELIEYETLEKKLKEEDGQTEQGSSSQSSEDIKVKTTFDRGNWPVPLKAQEELRELDNWTLDEQCLPTCSTAPFVVVCAKALPLLVNPLRIHIPINYPHEPATIQFDRSFPQDSDYGPTLQKLFEKSLGAADAVKTIKDFIEAFQKACEQYQKYISHYQPESSPEQQQQQETPDMVYVSHYSNRPAAPIAHKGMVM